MRITVVGDVLLDEDLDGDATRLSPDAPVPVIDLRMRARRAGGAGLAASLLARDGHEVVLVTALSRDEAAASLRACLTGITLVSGALRGPTPVKTRVRAAGHPVVRVDEGCGDAAAPHVTEAMLDAVRRADAILVSDYGRGLVRDSQLRTALTQRAREVPLVWDPHPRGATPVPGAWLVTPNRAEAERASGRVAVSAREHAAALRVGWDARAVAVTLGADGAVLCEAGRAPEAVHAQRAVTGDPCGAGDRFAATAVALLAASAPADRSAVPGPSATAEAVSGAVEAATDYLAAGGVASLITSVPPRADVHGRSARLAVRDDEVRTPGETVVATGGCFDLVHAGHVRTLQTARAMGDRLIVCVNSDDSVRRLKGPERPLIAARDRVELLQALACVDEVIVFDEDTPERLLRELRPDVWVKGGDYSVESLPESRVLREWGGRTVTVPYHLGHSTTALAAKLALVS